MRKALIIAAACGLALGAAACGKKADNGSANVTAADNMLVPADENGADSSMASNGGMAADNSMGMENSTGAMSNDMAGGAGNAQ